MSQTLEGGAGSIALSGGSGEAGADASAAGGAGSAALVGQSGWRPHAARTLAFAGFHGAALRGVLAVPPCFLWPYHAAGARLDYSLDVSAWLAVGGDTLAPGGVAAAWLDDPDPATIEDVFCIDGIAGAWISGGLPGRWRLCLTLTTGQGRVLQRAVRFPVI